MYRKVVNLCPYLRDLSNEEKFAIELRLFLRERTFMSQTALMTVQKNLSDVDIRTYVFLVRF